VVWENLNRPPTSALRGRSRVPVTGGAPTVYAWITQRVNLERNHIRGACEPRRNTISSSLSEPTRHSVEAKVLPRHLRPGTRRQA